MVHMMRRGDTAPAAAPKKVEMTTFLPALDELPADPVPIDTVPITAGVDAPTVKFYPLPEFPMQRAASAGGWHWFEPAEDPESGSSTTVLDYVNDIAGDLDSLAFMERVLRGLRRL
jgi:hypothetical protein